MALDLDRVLCPTDFSPPARAALEAAAAIAATFDAELILLHVITGKEVEGVPVGSAKMYDKGARALAERTLEDETQDLRVKGIRVRTMCRLGRSGGPNRGDRSPGGRGIDRPRHPWPHRPARDAVGIGGRGDHLSCPLSRCWSWGRRTGRHHPRGALRLRPGRPPTESPSPEREPDRAGVRAKSRTSSAVSTMSSKPSWARKITIPRRSAATEGLSWRAPDVRAEPRPGRHR